jgi:hypothetical protein
MPYLGREMDGGKEATHTSSMAVKEGDGVGARPVSWGARALQALAEDDSGGELNGLELPN